MTHGRRRRVLASVGAVGILLATGAACAPAAPDDPVQRMYAERASAESRLVPEESLADLLPNRQFSVNGAPARTLSAGVVVGLVVGVEPGAAYVAGGDTPGGVEVPFDDPNAAWRLMVVTLDVDEAVGSLPEDGAVRVVLPLGADVDPETFSQDVEAMGTVIAVLDPPGAFEVDVSAHPVHWDGVFLAPIDADGGFTFAALGDDAEPFQAGLDTVDELMAAAAEPEVVVESTVG